MVVTSEAKTPLEFRDEMVEEIKRQAQNYASALTFSKLHSEVTKGKALALHQLALFIDGIEFIPARPVPIPKKEDDSDRAARYEKAEARKPTLESQQAAYQKAKDKPPYGGL